MNEITVKPESSSAILPDSATPIAKDAKNDKGETIVPLEPTKYDAAGDIKKYGLKPTEMVEYKDEFTGEMKKFLLDRRGTNDEKLALSLLDPDISREQKDSMVSMWLFEKGKQGSSMLMDLWMYKGEHTKESRHFQSTMRFDFELFLTVFQTFMHDSADLIFKNLPITIVKAEYEEDGKKVNEGVEKDFVKLERDVTANEIAVVLGEFGRYHRMNAELLGKRIRQEVEKRERAKGKGIYLSKDGKPYSVDEDGDIVEVVSRDKAEADQEKQNGESN